MNPSLKRILIFWYKKIILIRIFFNFIEYEILFYLRHIFILLLDIELLFETYFYFMI